MGKAANQINGAKTIAAIAAKGYRSAKNSMNPREAYKSMAHAFEFSSNPPIFDKAIKGPALKVSGLEFNA